MTLIFSCFQGQQGLVGVQGPVGLQGSEVNLFPFYIMEERPLMFARTAVMLALEYERHDFKEYPLEQYIAVIYT